MSNSINQQVVYFPKEAVLRAVEKFETPFFLYDEARLRENCRNFKKAFTKYFPDRRTVGKRCGGFANLQTGFIPLYAVKANNNPELLKIIKEEGFGFDCSSESEAWITQKIGGWGMYTGNYTPVETLKYAKECGLILNLDDISMVPFLREIECGVSAPTNADCLSFRINPGIGGGERISVVTAGPDAKFGVPFEKAAEAYKAARELGVKKFGIHMMTGSNVPDENYFAKTVERLFEIVADIKEKTGIEIDFMNIGGGFGVPYKPEDKSLDIELVAKLIRGVFDRQCKKFGLKEPVLMAEPGRYIVADTGWLVGRVQVIKDGYKKFIGIDASSNDMPRPSIYGAYHYVTVVKKDERTRAQGSGAGTSETGKSVTGDAFHGALEKVSVVGTICENNDQFAKDRELPICEIGDIIVIHNCGGHAFAMGHNYNGKLRHAEYLLRKNGELRMIRRAETIEDLYKTCV